MANLPISGLVASAANLAGTDVVPVVQTTGVGPVKMTGLQLAGGLLGSTALTGATVTTSQPVLNLSQTWNAGAVTFTGLRFNATDTASAAASLLLDIGTGGGSYVSRFSVSKAGFVNIPDTANTQNNYFMGTNFGVGVSTSTAAASGVWLYPGSAGRVVVGAGGYFAFGTSGFAPYATPSTLITSPTTATLQLGAADAAAPVAQTLQVQGVVAGTSNTAGANFTIRGSDSTGNAAGGSIIFQVAPAGSSGTAQNAFSTALTIDSTRTATFAGTILIPVSANSTIAGIANPTSTNSGFYTTNGADYGYTRAGAAMIGFRFQALTVSSGSAIGFTSSVDPLGTQDVFLARDAANTLALRNGAAAQTYRIYANADGSPGANFQRLTLSAGVTSNMAVVAADNGGTGVAMGLQFGAALTTGGGVTNIMNINTSGHLVWNTDNTYDIGASGATRPRHGYFGGNIVAGGSLGLQIGNVSAPIYWASRSQISSPANGSIRLTNAATNDFSLLQFGGGTASFPGLKRSSTTLICRLADDSANAAFESASVKTDAPTGGTSGTWKLGVRVAATTTLDTTQYVEVDIGGTLYKLAVVTS